MSSRKFSLSFLALSYLLMLWVGSSFLSRRHGLIFVIPGVIALLVALRSFAKGHRRLFYALYLAMLLLAITAVGSEIILNKFPQILKGEAANIVYSGYYWQKGGIYIPDDHLGNRMRPNFERKMYWQGHTWRHKTNTQGFRGPEISGADAVFLGDSMIYGHGVEQSETVPAQFSNSAANLGQQETCAIQALILLEEKGLRLKPRFVFLCSHPTDLDDLAFWYETEELQKFLTQDGYRPLVRDPYRPKPWWNVPYIWSAYLAAPLRCSGIPGALSKMLRGSSNAPAHVSKEASYVPSQQDIDLPFVPLKTSATAEDQLRWKVHQAAIHRIQKACEKENAQLVLFDIGYPKETSQAIRMLAENLKIPYSPAGKIALDKALSGEPVYLANDGHWTPQGSRIVADELRKISRP